MDKKDLSRRGLLLAATLLLIDPANARGGHGGGRGRGGRGGRGGGGAVGLAVLGIGLVGWIVYTIGTKVSLWSYRRERARQGHPIPPKSQWAALRRCPKCGENMQKVIRSRRRGVKYTPPVHDVYRCERTQCHGTRVLPHEAL